MLALTPCWLAILIRSTSYYSPMVLVTGGLGVMGATLVKGLVERGFSVRVLDNSARFRSRLDGYEVDVRIGDITKPDTLTNCFDGVDTVYHLAAVLIVSDSRLYEKINVGGTRNVIDLSLKAGVQHFILVSSASVTYPHTTPYSLSKRETERLIKEQTAMKWTIVRPTLAYNENGGEEFTMFLSYLKKFPVVPFIGTGRSLKRPVHYDDLMEGCLAIPGNKKSYGKTYALSGGEAIPIWELGKLMLKHVDQQKIFLPIPVWIWCIFSFFCESFQKKPVLTWNAIAGVIQDANLDNSEARADLGYEPISVREGLKRSYPIS